MDFKKHFKEYLEEFVANRIEKVSIKTRKNHKDIISSVWWCIAKRIQDLEKILYVTRKIGSYMVLKNKEDIFFRAGITDIVVLSDRIFIYLKSPGMIIGKYGMEFDALTDYVNYYYKSIDSTNYEKIKVEDYKIELIEDLHSGYAYVLETAKSIEPF